MNLNDIKSACRLLNIDLPEAYPHIPNYDREFLLDDVRSNYLKLIKLNHPDLGGENDKSVEIITAYHTLKEQFSKKPKTITEQMAIHTQAFKDKTYKNQTYLTKKCIKCSAEFITLKETKKRCSACAKNPYIKIMFSDIKCFYDKCGKVFHKTRKDQKFCSKQCKEREWRFKNEQVKKD